MTGLTAAVEQVRAAQRQSGKPLAILLAGHNGSGKSTLWYDKLAPTLQIPLVNADRMMLSMLPDRDRTGKLPDWAGGLRDTDKNWMRVAQKGVEAFVGQAMAHSVAFAMETVFSYWEERPDGTVASKIELIQQMQQGGYFVLLIFVGLSNAQLSIGRVQTRVGEGGHTVATPDLVKRFPRTQRAIGLARDVADAAILVDNSRTKQEAFAVCRVQLGPQPVYDRRDEPGGAPPAILEWLNRVAPLGASAAAKR